jgi:hypothetical protein
VTRAAISGTFTTQSRDIYDDQLVQRSLVVVNATVLPGNSGSPLFVDARVAGMIFSRSLTQNATAYAVTPATVRTAIEHAGSAAVSTGACVSD